MKFNLLLIILGALGGIFLFTTISNFFTSWKINRKFKRGLRMEAKGEKLLHKHGYKVHALQEEINATLYVDGKEHQYKIRPDAFATKRRKQYVVEIKSGTTAPDPLFKETRRQILEYYFHFPVDGVLLVNAEEGVIRLVEFEKTTQRKWLPKAFLFLSTLLAIAYYIYTEWVAS